MMMRARVVYRVAKKLWAVKEEIKWWSASIITQSLTSTIRGP